MFRKNLMLLICCLFVLSAWMTTASPVQAQARLSQPERLGLTSVWSKAIPTGVGGTISGVHLHLSAKNSYTTTDIVDRYGRRAYFSDVGVPSLSRGGYDQIARLTELKTMQLQARGLEPRVETQSIPGSVLYIRSNSGMVTAMNAESGQVKWSVKAGKHGYPSYSVAASDEYVVAISSTKMYLIDAESGQVLDTVSTRSIPSGTPTLDGEYIYVPTWRGIIEVYSTEDFGPVKFTLGSTSPVVGTVTLCPDSISWVTDEGYLYVGNRQRAGIKFRFETPDTISSPPASMNGTLFAGSLDGMVYAIHDVRGDVKWRYSAGSPIDVSPLAVDDMIFTTTRDGLLTCLDAESGEPRWTANGIQRFVSASTNRLYCATTDHQLVVIETATGSRIASQSIGTATVPFVNIASDRLYLASSDGVLSCLRETGRRWPVVRQSSMIEAVEDAPPGGETTDETADVPAGATDDISADDASDAADFGGDTEDADDAGAADDADPFGALDDADRLDDEGAEGDPLEF